MVRDDVGNPLPGAKVHAELKGIAMAKAIRFVESDENGFFVIDRLEFGTYYVEAMKEEDGYGGISWSFFNDKPLPTVQISAQTRIADVVVSLGRKPESSAERFVTPSQANPFRQVSTWFR